ncbi:paraquat-inducible protein A [Aestuariibius sp. 2305UL40-4]|uniref:paraquat-inducible protein A n=1 Tax=Aestuariibius violaceus TaxID=3234132 RepID=UPI00345E503F
MIALTARDAGLVGCQRCTRVWPMGTKRCGRCNAPLTSRDTKSLSRVWAWWWAGVICYIPANTYPMLVTQTLTNEYQSTIVGGAIDVALSGDIPVAAIILFASVVIPVAKFIAIAFLAISTRRGTAVPGHQRHLLYEVVEFIGRWSMIDVFVVAITSALVQLNVVASVTPGPAAIAFALSVIFTMLSAQSFDSRMIWDQIEEDERR